jgi:hypothetical protein
MSKSEKNNKRPVMSGSAMSAARFLSLQVTKSSNRLAAGARLRDGKLRAADTRLAARAAQMAVEEHWRYVAAHVPNALPAWVRDVGLNASEFVLGTTGKPMTAVAIDRRCYEQGYAGCRCHSYHAGRWIPACHPPIVISIEKEFGV